MKFKTNERKHLTEGVYFYIISIKKTELKIKLFVAG